MRLTVLPSAALALALAACNQAPDTQTAQAPKPVKAPVQQAADAERIDPALQARVDQINKALYADPGAQPPGPKPLDPRRLGLNAPGNAPGNVTDNSTGASGNTTAGAGAPAPDPTLIKAEVLLARANFSPGVIDGQDGQNLKDAIAAYAQANGLKATEALTPEVWARLNAPGAQPVAATYTITPQDVAGPYYPAVGEDLWKMSKLEHVGFTTPLEMLAERFHMSQDLLQALNPGADFGKAGVTLVVAQVGAITLSPVDHLEVDKAAEGVRAYDHDGKLVAFLPATVGSTERPSPSGVHKVKGVARDPTYVYDPRKLTWGPRKHGKFTVPSGPNNPVGAVWIDLDAPSYGLHGTPDPKLIGKTASHGCVRMTNWDALLLASAVKPGVVVSFVGAKG
jgi:lipoprotein-anchoring transpeptidase ErfK/SrfK